MSVLKQLDRAARTAWCPSSKFRTLIASGTIAGTIDDSFETKSQLEIYDIDLGSSSHEMRLLGSIGSKDCFHSVAWGAKGIEDGSMPYGIVAGGMSDGSINIWNVNSILNKDAGALQSRSDLHKGQVLGLQFHPQQPNLLASGATDGEVYVWDLINLKEPKATKPNPSLKQATLSAITALAWNKNAPQILASSSEVGETTVWDLRQKRSIITIRNSARMNVRSTCLAWNPAASVQLAVSYSNYPVAEVWDLRQSMTPKVKLEGYHHSSILALDWCPHDPSILLTVGEDSRMASWNPITGAFLSEYSSASVNFDIQWSPTIPNLISTCSYDGKVNIESINHTGAGHVPNWMQQPSSVSFGFGGKLVSVVNEGDAVKQTVPGAPPSPSHKPKSHRVNIQQLVTDPEVLQRAEGLQEILRQGDFPNFCAYKVSHSADEDEKVTWTFMKILFEDEKNQRYLLLKELGFEPPASSEIVMPQPTVPVVPAISEEDFFNQDFAQPAEAENVDGMNGALGDMNGIGEALPADEKESEAKASAAPAVPEGPFREDADDVAIRKALVFGDFKAAVDRCLASNRMADAIVFASFGPQPLWEETRAAYFKQHKHPFIRNIMKCVSNQSLDEMVQQSELDNWRETLAILITYTTTDKYRELVNLLGSRLEHAGKNVAAVVCYICSSNIDKAIEMWTNRMPPHVGGNDSPLLQLHAAVEKIAVFAHATNAHLNPQGSKLLNVKYSEYASMLASQGNLVGAYNYLIRVANQGDVSSAVLLDRLFHAEPERFMAEHYPVPPFPYQVENVQTDPTLNQRLAQQQHERQLRQQELQIQQQQAQQMLAQRGAAQGFPQAQRPPQQAAPAANVPYGAHPHAHQQHQPQAAYGANVAYPPQQQGYGAPAAQQPYGAYGAPQQHHAAPAPAPTAYNPAAHHMQQPQQPQQRPPAQPTPYGHPAAAPNPYQPAPAPVPQPMQAHPQQYGAPMQPQPSHPAPAANPYHQQAPNAHLPAAPAASPNVPAAYQPNPMGGYNQPAQPPVMQPAQQQPPQPAVFKPNVPSQPVAGYGQPASNVPAPAAPINTFNPAAPAQPTPAATRPPTTFTPGQPAAAPTSAPAASAPAPQPAAPAAAPVNLSPADQAQINVLEGCLTALQNLGLKTPEQKKIAEIRQKLQQLSQNMSTQQLSPTAVAELGALVQAVAANDYTTAQKHHLNLVKTDWASNSEWILGLKTMLLMAKKYLDHHG